MVCRHDCVRVCLFCVRACVRGAPINEPCVVWWCAGGGGGGVVVKMGRRKEGGSRLKRRKNKQTQKPLACRAVAGGPRVARRVGACVFSHVCAWERGSAAGTTPYPGDGHLSEQACLGNYVSAPCGMWPDEPHTPPPRRNPPWANT